VGDLGANTIVTNKSLHRPRSTTHTRGVPRRAGTPQGGERSGGKLLQTNAFGKAYGQIIDAIERLVSLIQGEEGRDTRSEQVEELVKLPKADTAASASIEEENDLDVVEV